MDADTILRIKPALTRFLHQFDDCFGRVTTRRYLDLYVRGQLSDLQRKSVEPMADAFGLPPRNLQQFLSLFRWDHHRLRDRLGQYVVRHHHHPDGIGVIDETSFVKKGVKTACVQRQHCGAVGKIENCVVSVHLAYAAGDFHTLLDGELFLPQDTWDADRRRCRAAGIPDDVTYRPKWKIALDQYQRAVGNGLRFAWLTFDEGYGRNGDFRRALDGWGQNYVAEVPVDLTAWTRRPEMLYKAHSRDNKPGRKKQYPRLKVKNNPRVEVRNILSYSRGMQKQSWVNYRVKDGSKGPMVWQAKGLLVYLADQEGLPTRAHHLVVARNVLNPSEVKYFISNAPETTPVETLLHVAFSRWTIERAFEDSKTELGMDHFEARKFKAIERHLILSCVSHVFLSEFCLKEREKKSRPDAVPGPDGHGLAGSAMGQERSLLLETRRNHCRLTGVNATSQCQGIPKPSTAYNQAITCSGHHFETHGKMLFNGLVAL